MITRIALSAALLFAFSGPAAFGADSKAGGAAYEKSCKGCHGPAGIPAAGMAKLFPTIPELSSARVQDESDAELIKVIEEGKGKMKAMKNLSASPADVIAFVRTLKK